MPKSNLTLQLFPYKLRQEGDTRSWDKIEVWSRVGGYEYNQPPFDGVEAMKEIARRIHGRCVPGTAVQVSWTGHSEVYEYPEGGQSI